MNTQICPICGSSECSSNHHPWYNDSDNSCATEIVCKSGFNFIVHESVNYGKPIDVKRRYNLICAILLQTPLHKANDLTSPFKFFYDECTVGYPIEDSDKINLANNMKDYPFDIIKRVERSLINLSRRYTFVGDKIVTFPKDAPLFFCEGNNIQEEMDGVYSFLKELEYVEEKQDGYFIISANGWKKIYELTATEKEIKQGFIAMSFSTNVEYIRKIFESVIRSCGYIPCRIDQKEHNNQIVPEIFYEISRSKFLVVDVTEPNYGAYYEAGYGEALKKQVIVCCRKDIFDNKDQKPHFDIAQKSTIIWIDEKDLENKLKQRIEATVGLNR